jgi:putative transposase
VTERSFIPELSTWRQRPLDAVYPIIWLDAVFYAIYGSRGYIDRAIYAVLGLTLEGKKELLGLYLSPTENARYSPSILADLRKRGVKDVLIACVDDLAGLPEAINSLYPQTEVQPCIVYQVRTSTEYVAPKHQQAFMTDLRPVYQAMSRDAAEIGLAALETKWQPLYPKAVQSWRKKWEKLSAYFKYPYDIRRISYTTNIVEALHRQFTKLIRAKWETLPNESCLLELLYAGAANSAKKWTAPVQHWDRSFSQLASYFSDRLNAEPKA